MIETERLLLRPYGLEDYEPYCSMACDPNWDFPSRQLISREDAWHRVLRYIGHWSVFGYGVLAVIEKASGRYIGETGLWDFHRGMGEDFDGFAEAGWYFLRSAHGRGLAFEAAEAAHNWYNLQTGCLRTVCMIDPENHPSIRLARKLGYDQVREADYKGNRVVVFERVGT